MPRVGLFRPFSSKYPERENRLTWAFLAAVRYDPLLQNFLRELVESRLPPEIREHGRLWEPARILTQTSGIDSTTARLVSVLLTDRTIEDIEVGWSDREAVYDGVIEYPDGLTLIVENKLSHVNVWQDQLSPSRSSYSGSFDDVHLHETAICLEWSDILEGILKYADAGIAAFGSREICRDLLSFVEELHPELTPYRTFGLCGSRTQALRRRTISLLDKLARQVGLESRDDDYLFRPGKLAERVAIWVESDPEPVIMVGLWPADTVSQARRFFGHVDRTAFLGLDKREWEVRPNFHFSFVSTYVIKAESNWNTKRYFDYFANGRNFGQMDQARLLHVADDWEKEGLITAAGRSEIEDQFISTKRKTLNVVPGFSVIRGWRLDTVIELEKREELKAHVIDALAAPLDTWGETLRGG